MELRKISVMAALCMLVVCGIWQTANAAESCFNVGCGQSHYDFSGDPIPADFFGPGSDPFDGVIQLDGANSSGPDTIVSRDPFDLPDPPPVTDIIQIELVALNLVSCEPITVTTGGSPDELWDVQVELSPTPAPVGQMTITRTHDNGGTFTCEFYVQPVFTFTKVSNPADVQVLDMGLEGRPPSQMNSTIPYLWQDTSPKANPPCDGQGFYPLGSQPMVMQGTEMLLELHPPDPCRAFIALSTAEQWQAALNSGLVVPPDPVWPAYMAAWQEPGEGLPYPDNTFLDPELSVWPGGTCSPPPDDGLPSPGLVMAWGDPCDPCMPDGASTSSAWMYQYPQDPDLTNVTITITVFPPCGMNVVSFGMQDINVNFRAWYWNVAAAPGPGTLQCGVGTTIIINTALTGTGAANPAAASFMNTIGPPAFDITQVQSLIFDENNVWVAATAVPPPGTTVLRPWNYWRDLIITPNVQIKPTDPVKWSQPPVEVGPAIFLGWDELSVDSNPPLMADDWKCEDPRPVTDIHWWGSFLDWDNPDPPIMPTAFHIGIWTDAPQDAANPFSHPDEMVWEYICTNYQWNFAGYDKDPRNSTNPMVHDSCFQFYCDLPDPNWFYQKPMINGQGRVYWLSIAAVYPAGYTPQYPWGWKTRPHFFNDDAVRIFSIVNGTWPPVVGSKYDSGEPVEFPEKISWDLSFELTTNESEPNEPNTDLNLDGITNLVDVVFTVRRWLLVWP